MKAASCTDWTPACSVGRQSRESASRHMEHHGASRMLTGANMEAINMGFGMWGSV